jgi:hypothetical protein
VSRCAYHDEGLSMPCSCPFPEPPKTGQGFGDYVIIGSGYFIAPNADGAWALWVGDPDDSRPKEFATMEAITGRITVDGCWHLSADHLGEGMAALRRLRYCEPGAPGWSKSGQPS